MAGLDEGSSDDEPNEDRLHFFLEIGYIPIDMAIPMGIIVVEGDKK